MAWAALFDVSKPAVSDGVPRQLSVGSARQVSELMCPDARAQEIRALAETKVCHTGLLSLDITGVLGKEDGEGIYFF